MSDVVTASLTTRALLQSDLLRQHQLMHGPAAQQPVGLRLWLGMFSPRFMPVMLCRIAHGLYRRQFNSLAKFVSLLNFFAFGIEIAVRCPIGPGLFLPHTQGTVIGAWQIGANAIIYQGVTLGAKSLDFSYNENSRPVLADGVVIGAGAKVLGGVKLGEACVIGANSVVIHSMPDHVTAAGMPATVVRVNAPQL